MLVLTVDAGQDLDENLYAGFGRFPSNLPEMESLYYLAVDVQTVVGGEPLSPLKIKKTYSKSPLPSTIEGKDDAHYDKRNKPRLTRSIDGYECTRTCGMTCDCNIWVKIRKRKLAEDDEADNNDSDDEDDDNDSDDEEAN